MPLRGRGFTGAVAPMYPKPYVFEPKVFELLSYRRYSATQRIRCRCYSIDGYSRSGCGFESLASHRNYMCLSLSLSLLVIVRLLTVISAGTSAAEQEWILFDRGELRHLSYFIRRRILLQRQPFDDRSAVELPVESRSNNARISPCLTSVSSSRSSQSYYGRIEYTH